MSISFLRDTWLSMPGESFIEGWRWQYSRGFTIRIGTSLLLVSW